MLPLCYSGNPNDQILFCFLFRGTLKKSGNKLPHSKERRVRKGHDKLKRLLQKSQVQRQRRDRRSTSHIFAALKGRQNMVELYCLSPFQGGDQLLVRSQWFRTTLCSVLHHWLPSVAPPALDSWILQKPLRHIGHQTITSVFLLTNALHLT